MSKNRAREQAKNDYAQQRFRQRIELIMESNYIKPDSIIKASEIAFQLRRDYTEY